ncbi:MAG: hypothetical protein ACTSVV_00135 [Promethearchaeota archaeon]
MYFSRVQEDILRYIINSKSSPEFLNMYEEFRGIYSFQEIEDAIDDLIFKDVLVPLTLKVYLKISTEFKDIMIIVEPQKEMNWVVFVILLCCCSGFIIYLIIYAF